ncbi:STAS domain-containing protein [Mycolicibacterium brisbanense]|uniref:Sulfate transporter n=1 Tax=Mycolicibacterium brisbanense TaxID=146020 RepID=A0A100W4Z5_9MYCO|nr:STAS domain-containing protein [Mycolicibacterium brisbanense]MCV7160336.1 STAS domain-containing protein [Mycolicibacterium brisbanense]GAS91726.1 sulfate transporter [Mycolicibacterium brisbanense]
MPTADRQSKAATFRHHINCRGATVEARHENDCIILTATGEVDAANADVFVTSLTRFAAGPRAVIVDLRPMSFIGTLGLRGLQCFDDKCARSGTNWVLLAQPTIRRLLGIVCPDQPLHVVTTFLEAKRAVRPPMPAETG